MKKVMIFSGAFALMALASCQKNNPTSPAVRKPDFKKVAIGYGATQCYVESIKNCTIPASNCGSDVVIRPSSITELDVAIDNGVVGIAAYFNNTENSSVDFYPTISQSVLTNLQSGNYTVLKVNTTDVNWPGGICYKIGPANTPGIFDYVMHVTPYGPLASLSYSATQCYVESIKNCTIPASNCGPDVVIKPSAIAALDDAIANNDIAAYFGSVQNTSVDFYPTLTNTQLNALKSGNFSMVKVSSNDPNWPNGVCYKIGLPAALQQGSFTYVMHVTPGQN